MTQFIQDLWNNDSLRRYVMGLIAVAVAALNTKLGLNINTEVVLGILAFAATHITVSNWKSAKIAGIDAAAKVVTVDDAVKVLAAAPEVAAIK